MSTRTQSLPGTRPSADAVLTGSPVAQGVAREVVADPGRVRRLDVVAPGGHGKTVLLDVLAGAYRGHGITVLRELPPAGESVGDDVALLVDDAHLLDATWLDRLAALAAGPLACLVVAHRPWPHPPQLAALGAELGARRPPVVLERLTRGGVAARAELLVPDGGPAELVDLVLEQTGGLPALVDPLLRALGRYRSGLPTEPPADLIQQLGYVLDSLGPHVRDCLLARSLGAPPDAEVLGALLDVTPDAVTDLVDAAESTGLLGAGGEVVALARTAVLRGTSTVRRLAMARQLADIQLGRGGRMLDIARNLLGTGATGARIVEVFVAAGDEAMRGAAPAAADFYRAAVDAGGEPLRMATRQAEAALQQGDLDVALGHADRVLGAADGVERTDLERAGGVAAAALAHRGMLARSAEVYRWLGAGAAPPVLAVPALIGTGALDEARAALAAANAPAVGRPPTLLSGAEELMAQGVYDSVAGSPTAAMSQLARASALLESSDRAVLVADTPAALAALVALHCGELDVASSVLERAVEVGLGGRAAVNRHRLLQAWIAMQRGAIGPARDMLSGTASPLAGHLEPRDELFAAALDVALARRAGELSALMVAWSRAREAIVRHPVDLYAIQPLGELVVAAARLREHSWVQPHLDEAQALLARLGDPPLWAAPLHWSGVQSAVVSEAPEDAERHAAALDRAAGAGRYVSAMAVAARQWLALLGGAIDAAAVEAAARGLHAVGLTWEGGRLAGQAAVRTHDRKDMLALLGCARALQGGSAPAAAAAPVPVPTVDGGAAGSPPDPRLPAGAPAAAPSDGPLSDREREVAELVLTGMTYKEIGEQLFISAKTVEHHVARMRQRLGSGSRGELLAHLRSVVGTRR